MNASGILCLGALNYDTVAIGTAPDSVIGLVSLTQHYTPYTEMLIPDSVAEEIISLLSREPLSCTNQLGGSAFNVMRILLPFAAHLRLGYLGIAGRIGQNHPHFEFLTNAGVETQFVEMAESVVARAIAFSADGDRTLLTCRGANAEAAVAFRRRKATIVPYVASFDIVHITSYLDPETPEVLAELAEAALELNPSLTVSVDPGHAWSDSPTQAVERLLRTASLLHVNALEFACLGGRVGNEPDDQVAARVRNMMRKGTERRLVLRRHDAAVVYVEDESGRLFRASIPNEEVLPPSDVVDATGAGDTFTGGLLAVLASPMLQFVIGARVGATVAREKVRQLGPLTNNETKTAIERVLGRVPVILST
jgi:sugar/nucleoside kinase (ribokinase family)